MMQKVRGETDVQKCIEFTLFPGSFFYTFHVVVMKGTSKFWYDS